MLNPYQFNEANLSEPCLNYITLSRKGIKNFRIKSYNIKTTGYTSIYFAYGEPFLDH